MSNNLSNSEPSRVDKGTSAALRKLAISLLTLVVLELATYGSPSLKRFQPWVPGESLPLARLFARYNGLVLPAFAEAGDTAAPVKGNRRQSVNQLGAAVTANLGPGAGGKPRPGSRWRGFKGDKNSAGAAFGVGVAVEELEGLDQLIEDPEGQALAPFYDALLRTAQGEPKAITRIAHYGDWRSRPTVLHAPCGG